MANQDRDFKGVWIDKDIWLNPNLTIIEKVIYAEIDSLDNEEHCTAGNEYFAKFCGCSESKVSKAIAKLQELKLVEIISFDGRHRKIRLVKNTKQPSKISYAACEILRPNNINKLISKDINSSNNNKKNKDIRWFLDNYHDICVSLPKVKAVTKQRENGIQKLMKKYSKNDILECFRKTEASDFLKGRTGGTWKASIDFILREDKFISILEGKYDGKHHQDNIHERLNESGAALAPHSEKRKEDRNSGQKF